MRRLNHYIVVFTLCSLFFTLMGCRPKGILHSWEMRELLVDLHKTDALLQVCGLQYNQEKKNIYYAQILERHGTTQAQFDSSLVWYTAHPKLFDKIYPKVLKELKEEEEQYTALHEAELFLQPGQTFLNDLEVSQEDSQSPFTHRDLDSVLWVMQHGYPSTWYPMPFQCIIL